MAEFVFVMLCNKKVCPVPLPLPLLCLVALQLNLECDGRTLSKSLPSCKT